MFCLSALIFCLIDCSSKVYPDSKHMVGVVCAYELLDDTHPYMKMREKLIGRSLFNVSALPWFLFQTQQIVGL
jgi:hypothetical protein